MKKTISLIMVLALCLSLSACVQNKAVGEAEALITAIGPVTLDSEEAIAAAERAYEALSAEDTGVTARLVTVAPVRKSKSPPSFLAIK